MKSSPSHANMISVTPEDKHAAIKETRSVQKHHVLNVIVGTLMFDNYKFHESSDHVSMANLVDPGSIPDGTRTVPSNGDDCTCSYSTTLCQVLLR